MLHSVTGEPLPDIPVFVQQIAPSEGTGKILVFFTNHNGRAFLSPLTDGTYQTWVEWNNNTSNVEYFQIQSETDFLPIVHLSLNPDIDPV